MHSASQDSRPPRTSVQRRLVLGSVVLVVAALIVCTVSIYLMIYRPLLNDLTSLEMRRASEKVADDVKTIFTRVEAIASRNREWGMLGVIRIDDLYGLNRLFGPMFNGTAGVTSVVVAQDTGREILILSSSGGGWLNRLTNPEVWGKEARFMTWSPQGELVSSEQREVDYDARQRPWFLAAMARPSDAGVYWTPPYKFVSTQELGISAVVRWTAGDGHRYAMATDMRLLDLTRFTQQIHVGKSGLAAILTEDGTVLGLPRDARFATFEAIRTALLTPIDSLGIAPLAAAFAAWRSEGRSERSILGFEVDRAPWLTTFQPIHLADQTFWVATLAPSADFGMVSVHTVALGAMLAFGSLLIASLGAVWFGRRFSAPIEQLTAASARIGRMDLHFPIAVTSPVREIDVLAQSLEQMRLNLARAQTELEAKTELERQAERVVRESNEVLLESQRLGKVGYVRTDLVSKRREVSESLLDMLGLPRRAFFTIEEIERLIHPDDLAKLSETRAAATAAAPDFTMEFRMRHGNGSFLWMQGLFRRRFDGGGKPVAALSVLLDVTERKEREEALRCSEERYRALVEQSADVVTICRPDGTMLYRSRSVGTSVLGYEDAQVIGRSVFDRTHPDDVAALAETFERLGKTPGERVSGRVRLRHVDGSWRHIAWSGRNAMDVPGIEGLIITAHDITEVMRLQDQLQQAQKLEALGQLAGGIAHDFNNVLGAILGFASFLEEDLPADGPQHAYAQSILKAGQGAKDLVAQILAFARQSSVERKPHDLARLLGEAKDLLRGALPASTELVTEIEADGLVANVNLAQMNQLVLNLCLNANDALAGEPGRISLSLSRLRPDEADFELARGEQADPALKPGGYVVTGTLDPARSYARITVADTGPGMDDATLSRIFDPFFTTKERGRGTGLGLAVVRGIVAAYGGACIVASRPGMGTRFGIYLPLTSAASASLPAQEIGTKRGHGERIMVVDDDPSMAEMLTSGLERLGYKVAGFTDSRQALRAFAERPDEWDVVVSDQIMPYVTGIMLFEQLKAIRRSVCFILCTGFDAGATPERARALGIAAWFPKPVLPQEISAAIDRLMRERYSEAGGEAVRR